MAEAGLVVGFKAFLGPTTGGIEAPSDGAILDAMVAVRDLGMRLGFHAENGAIVEHESARVRATGRTDPLAHLDGRPAIAEEESVNRMALFALRTGCPIHIFHLTSAPGLAAVEAWRARGVDITCEVGPQHASWARRRCRALGSRMRINPPIRLASEGHGGGAAGGCRARAGGRHRHRPLAPHPRGEAPRRHLAGGVGVRGGRDVAAPVPDAGRARGGAHPRAAGARHVGGAGTDLGAVAAQGGHRHRVGRGPDDRGSGRARRDRRGGAPRAQLRDAVPGHADAGRAGRDDRPRACGDARRGAGGRRPRAGS